MRQIFSTIMCLFFLVVLPHIVHAGDGGYDIENCDRGKIWPLILSDMKRLDPKTANYIDQNIQPSKKRPTLTVADYKEIDKFPEPYRKDISECILLMKEINQLILTIHKKDTEISIITSLDIEQFLGMHEIPFIYLWNSQKKLITFTFDFTTVKTLLLGRESY